MRVNICPRCGNIDLLSPRTATQSELAPFNIGGKLTPLLSNNSTYVCKRCGYHGICPDVDESDIESYQELIRSKKDI